MIQLYLSMDASMVQSSIARAELAVSGPSLDAFFRTGGLEILQDRAKARFASEGDDAAGQWKQLKYITRQIRYYLGYPPAHPINVRTGALREFVIDNQGISASTGYTARLTWPDNNYGPVAKKFKGAQKGEGSAPPRPVVAANGNDLALMLSGIAHWVAAASDIELL